MTFLVKKNPVFPSNYEIDTSLTPFDNLYTDIGFGSVNNFNVVGDSVFLNRVTISGDNGIIYPDGSSLNLELFSVTFTNNESDINLYNFLISSGWDSYSPVSITINSGVVIYSTSTAIPALEISGNFPLGLEITNNGTIVGMGGAGGSAPNTFAAGNPGFDAGPALTANTPVDITNNGTVAGGGGGGGSGATSGDKVSVYAGGGGGGGRSGIVESQGGDGGTAGGTNQLGTNGTFSSPGLGGSGANIGTNATGGDGGDGGAWGISGAAGGAGRNTSGLPIGSGAGGGGGEAVIGNSNITWSNTGTRIGAIT